MQRIPQLLFPDGAPGALGDAEADRPSLEYFPAQAPNGAGVIIMPGGGYFALCTSYEGEEVAHWLNGRGYNAWMLRYRVHPYRHPAPLQDALQAVELVRASGNRGFNFGGPLGVWGFSAGGHLAATLATAPEMAGSLAFVVLAYPVIDLDPPSAHVGSRHALFGEDADPEIVTLHGAHRRVSPQTPPTFLFHTSEDDAVPVENSLLFYEALRAQGVAAELHVFQSGPHGVGLALENPKLAPWSELLETWLDFTVTNYPEATPVIDKP